MRELIGVAMETADAKAESIDGKGAVRGPLPSRNIAEPNNTCPPPSQTSFVAKPGAIAIRPQTGDLSSDNLMFRYTRCLFFQSVNCFESIVS